MSKVTKMDAESYLKSGSNELRVLEYQAGGMAFGINILKVNKIVSDLVDFTKMPESHPAVAGIFKDMNRLVPVVDLAGFLGIPSENVKRKKVVITEFFGMLTGFFVERIDWIHHFKWEDVIDAQRVFNSIPQEYVIGIVKPTEDRMVQLLDYESILVELCPYLRERNAVTVDHKMDFSGSRVLIVEDSPAVRSMLVNEMTDAGCEVVEASDGAHGWEAYQQSNFDLVICDVEMPQMDGLAMTLRIRQSDRPDTPVIVYSSIGDMGMKARAQFLKADAHITKLNLNKLIEISGKLMRGEKIEFDQNETTPAETEIFETLPVN